MTAVIARIAPVPGSTETIAEAGSFRYGRISRIALFASRCRRGSMVVKTFSPPSRTVFAPYSRCSSSITYEKKYGCLMRV